MAHKDEYSKEALDVLGKVPNSIVRYGLSVFMGILIIIAILLYFIKYPDNHSIPVIITQDSIAVSGNATYCAYAELSYDSFILIEKEKDVCISIDSNINKSRGTITARIIKVEKQNTSFYYSVVSKIDRIFNSRIDSLMTDKQNIRGTILFLGPKRNIYQRIFSKRRVDNILK